MPKVRNHSKEELEEILDQVPADYYQKAITKNIWHSWKLKVISELIKNKPNKILDVGCASGWFLDKVNKLYPEAELTGVDASKKAIDYGKKVYKNLNLIHADAHKLPFKDRSFDLILCTEVLDHVVEPEKVLSEIRRVLSPNGIAIVELDDSKNLFFRVIWYIWIHLPGSVWNHAHIHEFNIENLEEMIKKCKFQVIKKKIFRLGMGVVFLLKV